MREAKRGKKMEKFLKALVVFRQLITAEKMDSRWPPSHDPWRVGEGRGGCGQMDDVR